MNVTLEKLNDLTAKIIVNVEENDYKEKLNKDLKQIAKTHDFPGFRKGHVPFSQVERRFGKAVKSDIINQEVFNKVIEYLKDNKINILGEPLPIEIKEVSLDQKDYTFEYEVGLTPEVKIDLESLKLPFYQIKVTDEMVADQDKALRERFGAQIPGETVEDNALVKGAIMELNPDGSVKESEDAIQVIDGIVAPSYFTDKEQTKLFLGKKVGDKVVFNPAKTCNGNPVELASMLHLDKDKAASVTGDFELAISEIIVVRPAEHNEEFFKNVFGEEVKDEAAYNQHLREMIAAQLAPNSEGLFRYQAEKEIIEKFGKFELPAEFLKKWLVARNEELNAENIDTEYERLVPAFKWELLKGDICSKNDIKVEESELLAFAKQMAMRQFAQYGMTNLSEDIFEDYAKRMINDSKTRNQIVEQVVDNKMYNAIKAKAQVKNKEVSLDEFKKVAEEAQK
ncbi:MAG: trigger factor [Muribaculaceae bacterium]|nr:trigger factor [Muribaculaceae bacterium]